ncbi:Na/Pi cotransporter family protein [Ruminococcus flavefaciens]|uniref:Na/Pi cotransporter family protein n=1 Tax=Ruminococcus flavefaciens TaxID=1265 RepID=UPI0026F2CE79|nr:Na/Pi cotransporter family protein [Ruminococcus flavefaciens]MDD7516099.1 Na/Pi cotransporter family protein [Ruminococcus flavefaciens]MDY5691205.1 Na/Pi cotransporter family protein [Ruminococcus flavefaciens]
MEEFSIFNIFTLLGGLAFFLYGMKVMSTGLEKLTGGKLEIALKKMTSNKFKALLLGMGITIAIQSSSAMTVMLVGFVNSGIMNLEQTIGVCFGSDIGTTLTAWILSLAGVDGKNPFIKMLKPSSFAPLVALIGVIMIMAAKKNKKKDVGRILVGFAIIMTGMTFMSDAVSPLADSPKFQNVLTAFQNPILGVLVGAGFTGIIQSSAASVGILQAFSQTGALTYGMALPIIMGLNIGTCVTALISSIGVNKNAKRVACIHILIKILGTLILLPISMILESVIQLSIFDKTVGFVGIAVMHSIFNIATTIILLPFSKHIVKLSKIIIKDDNVEQVSSKKTITGLDDILLKTPAVAVHTCLSATTQMAELTRETIIMALKLLVDYNGEACDTVIENEDIIDGFEDKINSYLIKISKSSVTGADSRSVSKMMHCVGNFERISDHAVNLVESALEMHEKGISFSEECINEITVITDAITENVNKAFDSYENNDLSIAHKVEPLEEVVDNLSTELKNRHIRRLQNDECTVELGYIFQDVLTNLERISDHCSNIAGCLIETDEKTNIHAYLHDVKENDEQFRNEYREYAEEYFRRLGSAEIRA